MTDYQIQEIRETTKMLARTANFDESYTFYYDETNNLKKFYVRENDFNSSFTANFVLGGLVHKGIAPDVQGLIESFNLQKTTKEVKFKHIANGNFIDCLKSKKLKLFLQFLNDNDVFVHYSSLNVFYWAIVDIVDSAIVNSEAAMQLDPTFANHLKNDLYKLSRLEIDSVIELFYNYEYPNIKSDKVIQFIEDLTSLFDGYIDSPEYHFGLESLRQILKEAKKAESLPFIMEEENFILLKDLSHFYLRPIYLFKNSTHILDNEDSISEIFQDYRILDGDYEIKNYSFVDSQSNPMVQLSDVFVGLIGKFKNYINSNPSTQIQTDLDSLSEIQTTNLKLLISIIDKSENENLGFLHNTDSFEELSKMQEIWDKMKE
ncbi:DUF3800 domain-containing protein [Tenacibaculum maritimum]|uniref:DUF3800 domain-containing protein n=1 Tax=Tenacibaculum maritimum TaxID=107401 RepID=UPI0012E511F5|nr:DUF3800 domain-containing protein [Tenacibaculum maritimum]CAA0201045.1 conserved hypothetical protein [Tenacibaculum maritimum]